MGGEEKTDRQNGFDNQSLELVAQALKEKDGQAILLALMGIDAQLTGTPIEEIMENPNVVADIEKLLGNMNDKRATMIYFLSDGGYSRIAINKEGSEIIFTLTDNTTKKVRQKWQEIFGTAEVHIHL